MTPAPLTPAESFAALLARLIYLVVTRGLLGQLPSALVGHIINRVRPINQAVGRIAARVAAGTYKPRAAAAPRSRPPPPPRQPNPLPRNVGWLLKLVPETVGSRGQLEVLLRDPAMAELMAAAPRTLGRPLRSLCRMLGVEVPPVIAVPPRPRRPRPARPPKLPKPPRPEPPAWMRRARPRTSWSPAPLRGPPKRG